MRVLIVFHGRLPGGPYPVAGVAIRAWTNGLGLAAHGVEVVYASRRRDLSGPPVPGLPPVHPFEGRAELLELVQTVTPDLILAEGVDELLSLASCKIPIALDLFAPRVLEAQWQDVDVSDEVLSLVSALSRADYFLVTTERQRHYYLGLLPLAGVDCREDRIATVPLSVPVDLPTRDPAPEPLLVAGGVAWPWQDPRWALESVAARLRSDGRGALHLLRGPYPLGAGALRSPVLEVDVEPPLFAHSLLNYPEMLDLYRTAWCAVDLMAPNLERELALSFRQLDALRCGVPLLMGRHAPLAGLVEAYGAGWVVEHGDEAALTRALDELLGDPEASRRRSEGARRLALERFSAPVTIQPLLERIRPATRRVGRETFSASMARRATEARAQEQHLSTVQLELSTARGDLEKKDAELSEVDARMRALLDTVGRLSTSLESALYLEKVGSEHRVIATEESRRDLTALQRSFDQARREVAKKERELERLTAQRDQLEAAVARLEEEQGSTRRRADAASLETAQLRGRLQGTEEQLAALKLELQAIRDERDKKQQEIEGLWQVRDELKRVNVELQDRLHDAETTLERLQRQLAGQSTHESPARQVAQHLLAIRDEVTRVQEAVARAGLAPPEPPRQEPGGFQQVAAALEHARETVLRKLSPRRSRT